MTARPIIIASLIVCTFNIACSKINDNLPMDISIVKVSDSLTLKPISFSAIVSKTPDSYSWDFGDHTATSTEVSPKHTYQNMGSYNVVCTVTRKGVVSQASYRLEIKGDGRMMGLRRYTGTHTYNTSNINGIASNDVTRFIADTILTISAPSSFQIAINGRPWGLWQHDTGTEILYQTLPYTTYNKVYTYLFYYPANDSTFVYYSITDNPKFGDRQHFDLSEKK